MERQPEFIVTLMDDEQNLQVTRCKTNKDLAELLLGLDEAYMVASIVTMQPMKEDYRQFLKQEPGLEVGENTKENT